MYLLLLKLWWRNKVLLGALICLVGISVASIFIGKNFIANKQKAIEETTLFQKQHIERNVSFFNKEMGLLLYYLQFAYVNKLDNISALSIAQKDIQPNIQQVTIRGLQGQVYDSDLVNPTSSMYGNLDLAFVITYLFPLVIIAFSFNIYSEELEAGIFSLIRVQAKSSFAFLWYKLSSIAMAVLCTYTAIMFIAVLVLKLSLDLYWMLFFTAGLLYLIFWLLLCFLVSLFKQSSATNALVLLAFWVAFTLVIPGFLNNYVHKKYAIPQAYELSVAQRNSYHEKWDMPQKPTVDSFFKHYPQFKHIPLPNKNFSWLWYYAMQQMADDETQVQSKIVRQKLLEREAFIRKFSLFVPVLHTQYIFNSISKSNLTNYVDFLDSTSAFHERKRLYFYPKIFEEKPVLSESWHLQTPEYYVNTSLDTSWALLWPLLAVLALLLWGIYNKRHV